MRISRQHWDELVAHAREESPNECCGYLRCVDGTVEEVVRVENAYESPRYGFEFGFDALVALNDLDDQGVEAAVYHSHPRGPAVPSQMDINVMQWPHWLQLIVFPDGDPQVRAWQIGGGRVSEQELVIE